MMLDYGGAMFSLRKPRLLLIYTNYVLSVIWSCAMMLGVLLFVAGQLGWDNPAIAAGIALVPSWWAAILAVTYLMQADISHLLEQRNEKDMAKSLYWIIWYPLAFWVIAALTTIYAVPKVLFRKPGSVRGIWASPDRGFR